MHRPTNTDEMIRAYVTWPSLHQVLPEFQKDNALKALVATAMLEHSPVEPCSKRTLTELDMMCTEDGIEMQQESGLRNT